VGVAYLLALEETNELDVTATENIRLDQAIENEYLGLRNGILDQSGVLLSRKDHLTLIQCASAQHTLIPPSPSAPAWAIVIAFSGLRQPLGGTDYNRRVAECAEAARRLLERAGRRTAAPRLGNVSAQEYAEHGSSLSGPTARRAAHFFSEMERVRRGADAAISHFGLRGRGSPGFWGWLGWGEGVPAEVRRAGVGFWDVPEDGPEGSRSAAGCFGGVPRPWEGSVAWVSGRGHTAPGRVGSLSELWRRGRFPGRAS
jgi:hypothetical protein